MKSQNFLIPPLDVNLAVDFGELSKSDQNSCCHLTKKKKLKNILRRYLYSNKGVSIFTNSFQINVQRKRSITNIHLNEFFPS